MKKRYRKIVNVVEEPPVAVMNSRGLYEYRLGWPSLVVTLIECDWQKAQHPVHSIKGFVGKTVKVASRRHSVNRHH
jgi:hypothetical protein